MIHTELDEGVRVVTLARPDSRNALTPEGLDALAEAVSTATESVVYLRGEGAAFCAGADLDAVAGLDRAAAEAFAERGQRMADAIEGSDAVVVAGVDGPARGGGVELALACDIRVATPGATFAETGVKLGLFGAWGGTVRLPRILGLGDALEFALSGRTIDAAEARRIGLVSRVTDTPRAVAAELAEYDSRALAVVKARLRDDAAPERQQAREAKAFADLVARNGGDIAARRNN